tara:strand:+ start:631 stop:927 length:297 start_codon:yes stop_codon:yes gene_type:complete
MNKLHKLVRQILNISKMAKDDDRSLCVQVWLHQMPKDIPLEDFFETYLSNKILSTADSITRARRKLQEVDKTLRGKKWYERHNRAEEYKQEIVNFKYE